MAPTQFVMIIGVTVYILMKTMLSQNYHRHNIDERTYSNNIPQYSNIYQDFIEWRETVVQ